MTMTKSEIAICPKCGAADWTFDANGVVCNGCGFEREGPPAVQAGFDSLAALMAAQRETAATVPAEIVAALPAMLAQQLAAERDLRDRLAAAFEDGVAKGDAGGWKWSDARWEKVWTLDARLMYADTTVQLIEDRGHVMVCPNHGVRGVDIDQRWWEPLSLLGTLPDGGGAMAWTRYCERCSQTGAIAAKTKELMNSWKGQQR